MASKYVAKDITPMGLMRFVASPPERITEETIEQAHLAGIEQLPWPVRIHREEDQLILERGVSDSANLYVPWDIPNYGKVVLATGSLIERPRPYRLPMELARGKLAQLRNQLAEWQSIGLNVPATVVEKLGEAVQHFGRAAIGQDGPAAAHQQAEAALVTAVEAGDMLVSCYIDQAIGVRRRAGNKLPTAFGADLGASLLDDYYGSQFLQSFNSAGVPMGWRELQAAEGKFSWDIADKQIEWCQAHGQRVYGGPLLRLDRAGIPDWLCLYEGDFENILSFATEFIRAVVTRYRGKVQVWQCAGRLGTPETLGLSEEETLRLTARAIELVHSLDPGAPVVLSLDQPWGEYLSRKECDVSPIHFADALIRPGLGLSGLMLEVNMDYWPGGTLYYDLLSFSRRLDYWAMLGLPLHLSVCVPSGSHEDLLAQHRVKRLSPQWTPKTQQLWASRYIPLMIAKPYVQGVLWGQLRDSEPHKFPHGGLFDIRRHPKSALRILASIRQAHLR